MIPIVRRPRVVTGSLLLILLGIGRMSAPAADAQSDERIRQLEKRVEQLEKLLQEKSNASSPPTSALTNLGTTSLPSVSAEKAVAIPPPKPSATLSAGASGFALRSADSNFVLRLRGLMQVDSRWYPEDGGIKGNDGFFLRRVRPILEGVVFRDFEFRFTPEFGGSSPTIRDAWLNYAYSDELQLTVGKMKPPGGLERRQSVANIPFIERSLVSGFWPSRELGVLLHGDLWPAGEEKTSRLASLGLVDYAIGAFNGTGDDRSAGNADVDANTEVAARLFAHPFLKSDMPVLEGLGVGLAGTYENAEGAAMLPTDAGYGTEGQQQFFEYLSGNGSSPATATVIADGVHWRLGPQAYWYFGPVGLQGEYALSSQAVQRRDGTITRDRLNHRAWTINGSWLLTGEGASFKTITPKRPFDPHAGGWGALQFVARYSVLDIDNDSFPLFADPAESASRAKAWSVGLNWFLNRNVRASLNFTQTDFKGGNAGAVTRQTENAIITRAQLSF